MLWYFDACTTRNKSTYRTLPGFSVGNDHLANDSFIRQPTKYLPIMPKSFINMMQKATVKQKYNSNFKFSVIIKKHNGKSQVSNLLLFEIYSSTNTSAISIYSGINLTIYHTLGQTRVFSKLSFCFK